MNLVVVSHKRCWPSASSPSGFATDGGFPLQMRALAELFDTTRLLVPCGPPTASGEIALGGPGLSVVPLGVPTGTDTARKLRLPWWVVRNARRLVSEIRRADAVHAPIPGDIGSLGMFLALLLRKPLFVRYCGNWFVQSTPAERFWKWFIERYAGGRNVMLATGGAPDPPSRRNGAAQWIFSTTMTADELRSGSVRARHTALSHPRLIIVCRQEPGKGTMTVVECLPLVRAAYPDASLDVVGDGTALPSLKNRVMELGLDRCVRFHGAVDHDAVIRLLNAADLFCYPTVSEGFPKVVLEALACGLPVITTNVSVLPNLVHQCGLLLDSPTPATLAEAIRVCVSDPQRYQAMSENAIERAQHYSIERWRDAIGDHLGAAWGPLQSRA